MKYIFLLITLSYCALAGFTQEISGKITNVQNRQLVFVSNESFLKVKYDTVYIDETGNFKIRFDFSGPGYVSIWNINFEGQDLYVVPGVNLNIVADGTDNRTFLNTRKYYGSGAEINNFIAKTASADFFQQFPITLETYKLNEDGFFSYINKYYERRDSVRNAWRSALPAKHKMDKNITDFILIDSINATYEKTGYWFSYLGYSVKNENKNSFFNKNILPYNFPKDDVFFLTSPHYRKFWNKYINYKSEHSLRGPLWMNYWIYLPETLEKNLSGKVKQLTAAILEDALIYQYSTSPDTLSSALMKTSDYLLKIISDPVFIASYISEIDQMSNLKKLSRKGEPASDFLLVDSIGKKYTLADFRGKTVYMDIWASWCGPCIGQFPAAKNLIAKYKSHNDLIFLSVSVDNKKINWNNGVKLHNPDGLQLWAEGGYTNSFAKSYAVGGLPHYVLINKEGKIVDFYAPLPENEPAISNLLNEALR